MAESRTVFPGLIGNDALRNTLAGDLAGGTSAHAYILEGPSGSGKHTAARLICASVLCENRLDSAHTLPCCTCPTCRKILGGLSVDVLTVSNGEKASISVDTVRAVKDSLYITPNDGDKKFYVIENAHLMTPQAQNALLLSLEEPPPYVMFLLLCEDSSTLLETVRSRAPVLRMERFSPAFLEQYLEDRFGSQPASREKTVYAAHLAGGSLGRAAELYEHGDTERKLYASAEELVHMLLSSRKSDAIVFVSTGMPKERAAIRTVLSLSRLALRDILADRKGGELLFYGAKEGIPGYARKISARRLCELSDRLAAAELDLAANLSPVGVLTSLVMNA